MREDLGTLFRKARLYGRVTIFTSREGNYNCSIDFNTSQHITLEAKSGFGHSHVEDAVAAAIKSAEEIVSNVDDIKERKLVADK